MTIDLTTYGDRFDETTPYEKVLYNRDNILQASELTEQQSILHHYLGQWGKLCSQMVTFNRDWTTQ